MKKSTLLVLASLSIFTFTRCGDSDEKSDEAEVVDTVKAEEPQVNPVSETFFQVPSPGEMLAFIKMVGGKNNQNVSFLNPPANEKNYTDARAKALNFGIYSCDLSYCSIFSIGAEALKYFKTVKTMGDQIGISTAISPDILKRIEANVGNPDSLAVITDDVYFSSFQNLEEGKQGPTLAMMVAGGWIESIYIATNLTKYQEKSPVVERLADQKYTLENLIEFMKKHEANADVAGVKKDFEDLLAEFNKITEQDVTASKDNKSSHLLGGGKQLVMTEPVYKSIVEKIKTIRNSYTSTK